METLDKNKILELANHRGKHCISIFLPTHRKGHEVNEGYDFILFKNHVQKLRSDLQQRGLKSHEVENTLEPLNDLLKNKEFWKAQAEGLAVFRNENFFFYFQSPIPFEELSQVNHQFLVQPLLPLMSGQKAYHILYLNQNGSKLYKADPYSMKEVDMKELFPENLDEITNRNEFERGYQGRHTGRGDGNAAARGDDTEFNQEKDHLLGEYFRGIDKGVREIMNEENTPLILASVEYYQPIYRGVNTYQKLQPHGLTGNFDYTSLAEMHRQANELMAPYFMEEQSKRIKRYQDSSGGNLVSHDLREILQAAVTGQIDTLFVRKGAQVWGKFEEGTLHAVIHDERRENDEPLVDKAALITMQNGGAVYVVDHVDFLPGDGDDHAIVAALYRFAMDRRVGAV